MIFTNIFDRSRRRREMGHSSSCQGGWGGRGVGRSGQEEMDIT